MRPPVVAWTSLAVLLFTSFAPAQAGIPDPPNPSDYPHVLEWAAPSDYVGDLVVEIGVDWGADNACVVFSGAAGENVGGPGLRRVRMSDGGWGTSSSGSVAQVHAGDLDTRDLTSGGGGSWASRSWSWGSGFNGADRYTFAAFNTATVDIGGEVYPGFAIGLGCDHPFTITSLAGSSHVMGFTQDSMEGTGASAGALLGKASINVQDGLGATFSTDEVRFAIRGFQIYGAAVARVELTHPDGTDEYLLNTLQEDADFRGPSGRYEVQVTRAGAAVADAFWGILAGLDAVDDLDEIL